MPIPLREAARKEQRIEDEDNDVELLITFISLKFDLK